MPTLTRDIATFTSALALDTLPPQVVEKARTCVLNAFGMGLNGLDTPYVKVAREAVLATEGEVANGATLFGDGRRTTTAGACLANSALFHGRAQEDTCGAAHFGTILVPMLTAMIEVQRLPLDRLIPALVAGYESGGLLEQAFAGKTTPGGFRSTATYGSIAAAAAASRLMGLDAATTAAALANAVSFSGGVLQSFADGAAGDRGQGGFRQGVRRRRRAGRSCRFARPRLGDAARDLQALSRVRLQPDAGDRCVETARGAQGRNAARGARADESL